MALYTLVEDCDQGGANSQAADASCREDCTLQRCGDGVVDGGEECDDGQNNNDNNANACRTNCTLATCGDGILDADEECDDGQITAIITQIVVVVIVLRQAVVMA